MLKFEFVLKNPNILIANICLVLVICIIWLPVSAMLLVTVVA